MKEGLTRFDPFGWVLADEFVDEILCLFGHAFREEEYLVLDLDWARVTLSIFFMVSFLLMW